MSPVSAWLCEVVRVVSWTVLDPYEVVVPYSTWLVDGSSLVQVTVAPVCPGVPADTPEMTGGVLSAVPLAARTSMSDRFHMSLVGAVSLMMTDDGDAVGTVRRWVQKVSPWLEVYSSTMVWPVPRVLATALLQSLPTPQTHEPLRVVVSAAEGAPDGPLAPETAPSEVMSAPVKVATVIDA